MKKLALSLVVNFGSWIRCLRGLLVTILVLGYSTAVAAQSQATRIATATAFEKAVDVYPKIAMSEIHSGNTVAPPGYPIGEKVFAIRAGERVDIIDMIPNGSESRFTCKVRGQNEMTGFALCNGLEMKQWFGDRGDLVRILWERPYEYEGNLAGPLQDVAKLEAFVEKYPKSVFVPFARLQILSIRCDLGANLSRAVWFELENLKKRGFIEGDQVDVAWTPELSRIYSSLERKESERLDTSRNLCSIPRGLARSAPAPITYVEER